MAYQKNANKNLRNKLMNKGVTKDNLERKNELEEQSDAAVENLNRKRKEIAKTDKEFEEDMRRMTELSNKL